MQTCVQTWPVVKFRCASAAGPTVPCAIRQLAAEAGMDDTKQRSRSIELREATELTANPQWELQDDVQPNVTLLTVTSPVLLLHSSS